MNSGISASSAPTRSTYRALTEEAIKYLDDTSKALDELLGKPPANEGGATPQSCRTAELDHQLHTLVSLSSAVMQRVHELMQLI